MIKWKPYYRREFDLPGTADYLEMVFSRAEKAPFLDHFINNGAILSFPHTALHYAALAQSRVVVALYRAGVKRIVALGVLHVWGHTASSSLYRQAMNEEESPSLRRDAFSALAGAFVPPHPFLQTPFGVIPLAFSPLPKNDTICQDRSQLLEEEFSLDTFLSLLNYYYLLHNQSLPEIVPLYIGMTRNPLTNSFETASQIARVIQKITSPETAVVATGDIVHYGTGYSPKEVMNEMPASMEELEKVFREEIDVVLNLVLKRKDYVQAFSKLDQLLNNDQRYLLPVISECFGNDAGYDIISFQLSDYAAINKGDPPCFVASSLIAYKPGPIGLEKEGI